jgi:hypothetical protein
MIGLTQSVADETAQSDTGSHQGWDWKSFRAETSNWIIQMTPKVLQRPAPFQNFNTIKYKRPHSKTLEAPPSAGPDSIPFQSAKMLHFSELMRNHPN